VIRSIRVQETFEWDNKKKERVFNGYVKDVHSADLKIQELRTLELLGKHIGVGAFEERIKTQGNIILKVEYEDRERSGKARVAGNGAIKPNGHGEEDRN